MRKGGFPWGLVIAAVPAFILLCGLGVWQVQRLHWKEGLIAAAERAQTQPAAPLETVLARPGDPEFRRVVVDCPGLSSARYVELQSILDGQAGVRLVSLCPLADGAGVLVDRGFVADEVSTRPPAAASASPVRIEGVLRRHGKPGALAPAPSNGRFYARDDAAMAKALGATGRVAPFTVFAVTSSNPEWKALRPSAPPPAFSNNHLGYALTWFGLALALLGFTVALIRRRTAP